MKKINALETEQNKGLKSLAHGNSLDYHHLAGAGLAPARVSGVQGKHGDLPLQRNRLIYVLDKSGVLPALIANFFNWNIWVKLQVMCEVLSGYLGPSGLISIYTNKLARRA